MLRRTLSLTFLLLALSTSAFALGKLQGIAGEGGKAVVTSGISSSTTHIKTYPGCTIQIFLSGTSTLASIYSDAAGATPKANPFTSSLTDASWFFYAADARYDIRFSGVGVTTPFTLGAVELFSTDNSRITEEISLSRYASLSAAATAAGTTKQLVIDVATAPSGNLDLSTTVLRFVNGGAINPTTGVTITLGVFTAPRVQIFGGAGTIALSGKSNPTLYPEWWGVRMDGIAVADGAMTSSSTSLTSSSALCVAADASKSILVYGAGAGGAALRTTISSCSGSAFVLATSASTTVTGARVVYGTTNTTALTKALAGAAGGELNFASGQLMSGQVAVLSRTKITGFNTIIYHTANALFVSTNANNLWYEGLTIDAGGNRTPNGAVSSINVNFSSTNRSSDIRIQNCNFIDTFNGTVLNRQGVLVRNADRVWILNNYFAGGMRIKAGFGGNQVEIAGNILVDANDNAISFLDNSTTTTANYHIHHNFVIAPVGCGIVFGDDGGGSAGQTFYNITIDHNIFYGPLQDSQSFIQYRGSNVSRAFKIDNNTFYNTGSGSNTFAINIGNQTGIGTDLDASEFNDNVAFGAYDKAAFKFSNIKNSSIKNPVVTASGQIVRGLQILEATDVLIEGPRIDGCYTGIEFLDNSSGIIVRDGFVTDSTTDGVYMGNNSGGTINVKFDGITVRGSGGYGFNEATTGIIASYKDYDVSTNTSGNFQFNGTGSFREGQRGVLSGTWTTGLTASTTFYLAPGAASTSTAESQRLIILPATTISYLAVTIGGNQPASGTLIVTLRQNGSDTALTVTVPANSFQGFSVVDSTHSVRGEAGDYYSFKVINNASGASCNDVTVSAVMN